MFEFRLLADVEIIVDGQSRPARRPQQNAVLAALLVDAGRPVPAETLIDRVWGEVAPHRARRCLQIHLSRIRRQLATPGGRQEHSLLGRSPAGYLLAVPGDWIDLHRFGALAERARERTCPGRLRLALLREAMRLWRGDALGGVPGDWAARTREFWRLRHLDAVAAWADAELRAGDPGAALAPVAELAGRYPLFEPLSVALMRTLAATGHSATAIEHYGATRRCLADELGIDPGPELRAAYRELLAAGVRQAPVPVGPASRPG